MIVLTTNEVIYDDEQNEVNYYTVLTLAKQLKLPGEVASVTVAGSERHITRHIRPSPRCPAIISSSATFMS